MKQDRCREQGFALLEAIVAMAIASLALTTIYRTIGDGMRTASRVQTMQAAIVVARSHLDSLGSDGTLQSGASAGAYDNGMRWRLSIADLSTATGEAATLRPYWITLIASDRTGAALLTLETAKLAREAKP